MDKKYTLLFFWIVLLSGCADIGAVKKPTNEGFFADATSCSNSAMRKEKMLLPSAGAAGMIEVPIGYDADKFIVCMEYAGRPVAKADPSEYLKVSTACLHEAQGAENPDEDYADCIRRSRLNVDIISGD